MQSPLLLLLIPDRLRRWAAAKRFKDNSVRSRTSHCTMGNGHIRRARPKLLPSHSSSLHMILHFAFITFGKFQLSLFRICRLFVEKFLLLRTRFVSFNHLRCSCSPLAGSERSARSRRSPAAPGRVEEEDASGQSHRELMKFQERSRQRKKFLSHIKRSRGLTQTFH